VAITQTTRQKDERLRKELENADLEKFKKALKLAVLAPKSNKPQKRPSK